MYTLRIISKKDKTESNHAIGNNYSVHMKGHSLRYDELAGKAVVTNETFAIISADNGKIIFPLHRENDYYIMTESGKIFEHLQ